VLGLVSLGLLGCATAAPAGRASTSDVTSTSGAVDRGARCQQREADLDGDGVGESVCLLRGTQPHLAVLRIVWRDGRRWTSPLLPAFSLHVGDLDGAGADEVVLGVWSWRRRHNEPQPHRAVWVLAWSGAKLQERWRGSALARPLVDLRVRDLDGDGRAELLSLERGGQGITTGVYRFDGFGFVGLDAVGPAPEAWIPEDLASCSCLGVR